MADFIPTGVRGLGSRTTIRRSGDKAGTRNYERQELIPPPPPPRNFMPDADTIDALIERALAAFARGIYWDRGTIINLVL